MSTKRAIYHLFASILPLFLVLLGVAATLANYASISGAPMGVELCFGALLMGFTALRWGRRVGPLNSTDLLWCAGASSGASLLVAALLARLAGAELVASLLDVPVAFILLGLIALLSREKIDTKLNRVSEQ